MKRTVKFFLFLGLLTASVILGLVFWHGDIVKVVPPNPIFERGNGVSLHRNINYTNLHHEPADWMYVITFGNGYQARFGGSTHRSCDIYLPEGDGPFPAVVMVHDGAWACGSKEMLRNPARELAQNGYAAIAVNYRLAPHDRLPAARDDIEMALEWVQSAPEEFKLDKRRVALFGYSAGGHVAALSLLKRPELVNCTVLIAAPTDLVSLTNGTGSTWVSSRSTVTVALLSRLIFGTVPSDTLWLQSFSPVTLAKQHPRQLPSVLLVHGAKDELVSIAHTRSFADVLMTTGTTVDVVTADDAGHVTILKDDQVKQRIIKFLDQHLKQSA